ncbi:acyltransferase family protein [Streptomyces fimbriatus]|uniref:Acyltransferase family protein n=1 Tax=Streptomyces fimbriatus TaxID=68197 RepID=A0ABW0D7L6_STRFI
MANDIPNGVAQVHFPIPGPASTPGAGSSPAGGARDAFFDNAKYLLIVLVAVAHAWELVESSRATKALYILVYTFHMPAFIIISGYLSRSFAARPRQIRRLISGIVVPYVVFETAYSLFRRYVADEPGFAISLLDPFLLTWFLAALFIWRLTTPLWLQLRHPLAVALAVAVPASVTPGVGEDLNLQRVLQFLPFFVLGLCLKPEHFRLLHRRAIRMLAIPLFAGALAFAYWAATRMRNEWFFRRSSAQEIGEPWWTGVVMTFALFGCSLLLTAAFLAWVPRRRTWFTVLGAGTICGYLLHGFLTKGAKYSGLIDTHTWLHDPAGKIVLSVVAAVAVTLMCTPPVRRLLRPVTEPDLSWAFRRDPAERPHKG